MSKVLYTELNLNRNLKNYRFPKYLDDDEALEIINKISSLFKNEGYSLKIFSELTSLEKYKLYDDYNISYEFLSNENKSAILIKDASPAILLNGENHIEIRALSKSLDFKSLYESVSKIDDLIDNNFDYSYDDDFGFLTVNPQNCGTAMIPKAVLHLPATKYFGIDSLIESLNRLGYKINGFYFKDINSIGGIYEIYPDRTIGESEEEYISKLESIIKEILDIEEQNRKKLYLDRIIELEDMVKRAYGILRNCRLLTMEELIDKFSYIYLGCELGILKSNRMIDFFHIINTFSNGQLQFERGSLLDEKSKNILRANKVRKMMKEVFI